MIETPTTIFKNLRKEIRIEFIGAKLDSKEMARECRERLIIQNYGI